MLLESEKITMQIKIRGCINRLKDGSGFSREDGDLHGKPVKKTQI